MPTTRHQRLSAFAATWVPLLPSIALLLGALAIAWLISSGIDDIFEWFAS